MLSARPARAIAAAAVTGAVAVGCADTSHPASDATTSEVIDSAGVRIVRTVPEAWPLPEFARVSSEPIMQVGELDGAEEYNLDAVQGVRRTTSGGVVALEFMSRLRWYGADGLHQRTLDFFGEGPGEMKGATSLFGYRGDSLLVRGGLAGSGGTPPGAEPYPGREVPDRTTFAEFLVFDASGEVGRRGVVWAEGDWGTDDARAVFGNSAAAVATLGDGSFVNQGNAVLQIAGNIGERVASMHAVTRSSPLGAQYPDTILLEPFSTVDLPRGGSELSSNSRIPYQSVLFGAGAIPPAAHGDRLYVADVATGTISVYRASGEATELVESWRPGLPATRVEDATVEAYLDAHTSTFARSPEDAADTRSRQGRFGRADSLPRFEALLTDAAGNLWASEGRPYSGFIDLIRQRGKAATVEPGPTRWTVISPDGELLGRVETPLGFQVEQIGEDWILGLVRDDLQVPRIRIYALVSVEN